MWWTKVQVLPESLAPLAQQGERCAFNAEVMGSIPQPSTGSLAQMVERTAFNRVAEGSIPSRIEVETLSSR